MKKVESVISFDEVQKHTPEELKKIRFERLWEKADVLKFDGIERESLRVYIVPILEENAPKPSLIKGIINGYEIETNFEFDKDNYVCEYLYLTAEDMDGTTYKEREYSFFDDEKQAQEFLDEIYSDLNEE